LSQSHVDKFGINHTADLKKLDLLVALILHILIFSLIAAVMFWQHQHKIEPLKRIEVMMISAKQLSKLEHHARRRPVHAKKHHIKPRKLKHKKIKHKKVSRPKKLAKPKPKTKTIKKHAVKKSAAAKSNDDFDPFAPIASSTDRSATRKKASTSRPELANLAGKQLSRTEKERYIALMQAAVQQHWKLPVSAAEFTNPLVEMHLLSNGNIATVKILESSGNAAIDASLIRAIQAAAPFELPRQQFEFFRVNRIRFHPMR